MKLYGYWRSSSAWRVRIALGLKGIAYENVAVHLLQGGGQQFGAEHLARNPLAQVPVLEFEHEGRWQRLTQSVAIIAYLDELRPEPPLFPRGALERARVLECVEIVNSGTQPLQNRLVLERVAALGADSAAWAREFIARGLLALEAHAELGAGRYLVGDAPSAADAYLVPQLYNGRRFGVSLDAHPLLLRVEAACNELEAFRAARPEAQPDAELDRG